MCMYSCTGKAIVVLCESGSDVGAKERRKMYKNYVLSQSIKTKLGGSKDRKMPLKW